MLDGRSGHGKRRWQKVRGIACTGVLLQCCSELKHALFARTCQRYRARVVADLTGLGQIRSMG